MATAGALSSRRIALFLLLLALTLALTLAGQPARAEPPSPRDDAFWYSLGAEGEARVHLYFFWTRTCPHCREARPFVERLARETPWLVVHSHEVGRDRAATARYVDAAAALGQEARSVPAFLFCRHMEVGFDTAATTGARLRELLETCRAERGLTATGPAPVDLPVIGTVDPAALSLPVLTVVIAGLDAFNPCAFFVLLFLLSLLVHARSRRRMAFIGGVFVTFSGLVYFAFMAAWLNLFLITGEMRLVTLAAGAVALFIAAVNVKDYFWFKRGLTLSIPERAQAGLFRRVRGLTTGQGTGALLLGTIALALAANSYELLCTAGLPMVYTRILTLAELDTAGYYGYLALYNLVYVLPLAAIVGLFTWTLGARKLGEYEGRLLKLLSGLMMGGLGLVLLTAPEQLSNPLIAAGLLLGAVAVTLLVAGVHRARRG